MSYQYKLLNKRRFKRNKMRKWWNRLDRASNIDGRSSEKSFLPVDLKWSYKRYIK